MIRQTINIPLARSLDTETDPKLTQGMLKLENARIDRGGEIRKRGGHTSMPRDVSAAGGDFALAGFTNNKFVEGAGIYDFRGQPVILARLESYDNTNTAQAWGVENWQYFAFNKPRGRWVGTGESSHFDMKLLRLAITRSDTGTSVTEVIAPAFGAVGANVKYIVCAYYDLNSGHVFAEAFTHEGVFLYRLRVSTAAMTAAPSSIFVGVFSVNKVCILWGGASDDLKHLAWWLDDNSTSGVTTIQAGAGTTWRAAFAQGSGANGELVYSFHKDNVTNDAELVGWRYGAGSSLTRAVVVNESISAGGDPVNPLGLYVPPRRSTGVASERYVWVAFYRDASTTQLRTAAFDTDGGAAIAELATGPTIDGPNTIAVDFVGHPKYDGGATSGYLRGAADNRWGVVVINAITAARDIQSYQIDTDAAVQSTEDESFEYNHIHPQRPFVLGQEVLWPLTWFGSDNEKIQSAVFFCPIRQRWWTVAGAYTTGRFVGGVALPGRATRWDTELTANNLDRNSHAPAYFPDGRVLVPFLRLDRLAISANAATENRSIVALLLDPAPAPRAATLVGSALVIPGGVVGWYDGRFQELGFHLFPARPPAITVAGGGALSAGVYSYRFVHEWNDALGNVHRSAASTARTVTAAANDQAPVVDTGHGLSHYRSKLYETELITYRTIAGGAVHYRDAALDSTTASRPVMNPYSGSTTTVDSDDADSTIDDNEVLPLDAGETQPGALPGCHIIVGRRDRLFAVPMEDRHAVWTSKPLVQGRGPEFNEALQLRFDQGGDITALAIQDDYVIVFHEGKRIEWFAGDGPNAKGQGAFSVPRTIAADASAINQNGVVTCRLGTIFKSKKGFMLLGRDLQVDERFGLPMAGYNDNDVLAALLLDSRDEIRFVLSGGVMLSYDLSHGVWATHSLVKEAAHAAVVGGEFMWLAKDGTVYREDETATRDGIHRFSMVAETPWVKPDLLPEMSVYRIGILGDFKTRHTLRVGVYYDYIDEAEATLELDTDDAELEAGAMHLEVVPPRARCRSIKLRIEDVNGTGDNLGLTSLTFDVGVESKLSHAAPSRRM